MSTPDEGRDDGGGPAALPLAEYGDLTPVRLATLPFDDPTQACRILQDMAGHNVPDSTFNAMLRVVGRVLATSADPDRAVANLARWADAAGSRAQAYVLLIAHPQAAEMLLTIFAASQYFSNLLIKTPEYLEVLTNPRIRDRERGPDKLWDDLARRVSIARTANGRRDALRRFKPPEILRIGARDLLGYAQQRETTRAISDFADASLRMALKICAEEQGVENPPFAIIAMGKLGGREVNYSSDIDLIFVHGESTPDDEGRFKPIKLAEAVRDTIARSTEAGFVFRVDLRLRPEGRFGPITRSLESCRAYYESWAELWERQALLKARFVAGDPAIGEAFLAIAEGFAYRSRVEESFVLGIRENKRRIEAKVAAAGETEINVKEGHGGIRDIEFTVQLLQLIAGGKNPRLRTPNTPDALDQLARAGMLTAGERDALASSYLFLREVEHRLQIMDELPIRCIPTNPRELGKFGRRLGYAGGDDFLSAYRSHTAIVHNLLQRIFYGRSSARDVLKNRLIDRILESDAAGEDTILEELAQIGYHDPAAALAIIRHDVFGSEYGAIHPDARAAFVAVADALVQAAASTLDPDAALRGIDALAVAVPSRYALYRTLTESPDLLPRLARLAAESPPLWQTLIQHQELFDLVADREAIEAPVGPPSQTAEERGWNPLTRPERIALQTASTLAQWIVRTRLRTGVRTIWELADVAQSMHETTVLAETVLRTALRMTCVEEDYTKSLAIIGMGKLGGAELGYSSDWDVLYVASPDDLTAAGRVAKRLQQFLKTGLNAYGLSFDVDARLRPDGRKGEMVLDIESYSKYWRESAAVWERQAHIKARFIAGDKALGTAFIESAMEFVYGTDLREDEKTDIRKMKLRIERERAHSADDLKLGPGGISDIEWICQLQQLAHGHTRLRLQRTNTLEALKALRDEAFITQTDWDILTSTYLALVRSRNQAFLKAGVAVDVPTPFPTALRSQMDAVRQICLRLFYDGEK